MEFFGSLQEYHKNMNKWDFFFVFASDLNVFVRDKETQ